MIIGRVIICNMKNKTTSNFSDSFPTGIAVDQPANAGQNKAGFSASVILTLALSAAVFGIIGFALGRKSLEGNCRTQESSGNGSTTLTLTMTSAPSSAEMVSCEDIEELAGYQICRNSNDRKFDYILGPSSVKIEHVSGYSVSPNKEWLFVVRYSDEFVKAVGAPDENALTMVDVKKTEAIELFSQIYFPNYTEESWSPAGNGIVFTAGESATPNILGDPETFAVVYCTTSCKVLARNAGPEGIGENPAYFANGKVHYTGMNDKPMEIPLE